MERMIIYGLVLLNLCIGLLLYYHRPRPFGRGTYEVWLPDAKPKRAALDHKAHKVKSR
ncbi:MAG: hypothetical protein ACLUJC_01940 [Clostridia bacterium]